MSSNEPTYAHCAVQLNLFSLMNVVGLVGVAGGISWGLIICVLDMFGLIELQRFDNYLVNILFFPLLGAAFGMLFSFVGYPIYAWFCKNNGGQKLSGIFHNPVN
ncbi:MAG: hypothetical protein V4628_17875 [Pseudomonadota bacterium]